MTCVEVREYLNKRDEVDTPALDEQVADHVEACSDCRRSLIEVRLLETTAAALPREIQPARDLWAGISSHVTSPHDEAAPGAERKAKPQAGAGVRRAPAIDRRRIAPLNQRSAFQRRGAIAASLAVAAVVLLIIVVRNPAEAPQTSWLLERVDGAPSSLVPGVVSLGQRLETGRGEKVRVVADLGEVVLGPESALSVRVASEDRHVFALERGSIHADILAPPRVFFVETKLATAIDLGCTYTLEVDESGEGRLTVSAGWVALEREGREWIVPAGASARIASDVGPQVPVFDDASDAFQSALERVVDNPIDREAFDQLLGATRAYDSLTLWHLAFDVRPAQRVLIYEAIKELGEMPASISTDDFVVLDGDAMDRLRLHLEEDVWLRPDLLFGDDVLLP